MDEKTLKAIEEAVERAFSAGVDDRRFIDVTRIPLICQSIVGIDRKLEELKNNIVTKDQFWPVKTLVYGMVSVILLGVTGALLALVIK